MYSTRVCSLVNLRGGWVGGGRWVGGGGRWVGGGGVGGWEVGGVGRWVGGGGGRWVGGGEGGVEKTKTKRN